MNKLSQNNILLSIYNILLHFYKNILNFILKIFALRNLIRKKNLEIINNKYQKILVKKIKAIIYKFVFNLLILRVYDSITNLINRSY